MTNKTELLFIRACYSKNPYFRFQRLLSKFFIPKVLNTEQAKQILEILGDIVENLNLMSQTELIAKVYNKMALYPTYEINNAEKSEDKFIQAVIAVMVDKIRTTKKSKLFN